MTVNHTTEGEAMSDQEIHELAGQAYDWFERKERGEETIVVLKDGAPDWLTDLVREAHGDFLPDDWRYGWIREALGDIHDNPSVDLDELGDEFADGIDTYTARRLQWLASNLNRPAYCDEALEEYGIEGSGGIINLIGLGQYMERREVFDSVRSSLEAQLVES